MPNTSQKIKRRAAVTEMEANPISIILVKSDSKGDRLLFRYPYINDTRPEGGQQNRRRNPYSLAISEDLLQSLPPQTTNIHQGQLTGFADEVLSTLFAVKPELCENKFELKVNDVRFVGHPTILPPAGSFRSSYSGAGSSHTQDTQSSTMLINIVFALQATASHSIVKCYHDLSRRLGVALRHEERRCGYVTEENKLMIMVHDEVANRLSDEGQDKDSGESPFDLILARSALARLLKSVFQDLVTTGLVRLRVNGWLEISFCLPQKVHQVHFHRKAFIIEPEAIDRCLQSLRPYHGFLLLVEPAELLEGLPPDSSPALMRLIRVHTPLKSLQTLSADADLNLAQVFQLTGHLVYWAKATVIYPLCESNVYVVAPDAPTDLNSPLVERFSEQFPGMCLLQVMSEFSLPTSIGQKVSPLLGSAAQAQLIQTVVWLLRHRLLRQLHTYVFFMATGRGLSWPTPESQTLRGEGSQQSTGDEQGNSLGRSDSGASSLSDDLVALKQQQQSALLSSPNVDEGSPDTDKTNGIIAEELLSDFSEEERVAILKVPAATNVEDLTLLSRLYRSGYLRGRHHLEEMMYLENLRRSQLLQLLDKFRDVLLTCETEDPAIATFYSHSS